MSKQLLEAVQKKDPLAISEAFDAAMKEKCSQRLDEMRKQVLSKTINESDEFDYDEESELDDVYALDDTEKDDLHHEHTYRISLANLDIDDADKRNEVETVILNTIGRRGTEEFVSGSEAKMLFQKVINSLNMAGLQEFICCVPVEEVE